MPITPQQVSAALSRQHAAAHDPSPQVRLIAGPGTGKSFAIQERVRWLLQHAVPPDAIHVVSFTRASARDLRHRVHSYCAANGLPTATQVGITTLHSLALRALRQAGLLVYPADPLVLDDWELDRIHDPEYSSYTAFHPGQASSGTPPARAREIRLNYEAFCGTGLWHPPTYIPPQPPITPQEQQRYASFHQARTQLYSYVLPGEIVRQCVDSMNAGSLDPASLLDIRHLIVDEYQDLNPMDLEFVDGLIRLGVTALVAGDDDQSLYSFRHASPRGIQSFLQCHPSSADHYLTECFRSTPDVLAPAHALIAAFSDPMRVPKQLSSLYIAATPVESGIVHRWRFQHGTTEARAIAESCRDLIAAGVPPREVMILVSNTRAILPTVKQALADSNIPSESPRGESFFDTRAGRYAFALVRLACQENDYVAHRLLLGLQPGVGPTTCNAIAQLATANSLNYRDLFYQPIPQGTFSRRELNALDGARPICAQVSHWIETDTLSGRLALIHGILNTLFGQQDANQFLSETAHLPPDMTLLEFRDYLWADNDEQRANILSTTYARLGLQIPQGGFLPPQVRIMTMHGSKGLSATVVFIPALEEQILPGPRRQPYPGLVLEAARMLYVSITRARAACVLSYADTRVMYGAFTRTTRSRFIPHLAGTFVPKTSGFNRSEVAQIVQATANL